MVGGLTCLKEACMQVWNLFGRFTTMDKPAAPKVRRVVLRKIGGETRTTIFVGELKLLQLEDGRTIRQ